MGARSDSWLAEEVPVLPYAAEVLPEYFENEAPVNVRTILAERTCLLRAASSVLTTCLNPSSIPARKSATNTERPILR
ncbi:hypothetical protein N8787_02605 [Opitutaceae bacterium]|nr:hypothetical protein [Opitutaceae bacterium]